MRAPASNLNPASVLPQLLPFPAGPAIMPNQPLAARTQRNLSWVGKTTIFNLYPGIHVPPEVLDMLLTKHANRTGNGWED